MSILYEIISELNSNNIKVKYIDKALYTQNFSKYSNLNWYHMGCQDIGNPLIKKNVVNGITKAKKKKIYNLTIEMNEDCFIIKYMAF